MTISHELYTYPGVIGKGLDSIQIKIGGHSGHVPILCKLSKRVTVMKLLEEIKKSSSKWIKTKGKKIEQFYWQDGCDIFSLNPAETDRVFEYISHQREHRHKVTFQGECGHFLKNTKWGMMQDLFGTNKRSPPLSGQESERDYL